MKIRNLLITALFIALSFIGANIKILGSIAFDSMPAFLGALILGPVYGALIGAIGHFLTAAISGFYLTLPVHLIIMVDMAVTMVAFGVMHKVFSKKSKNISIIASSVAGLIINGPIAAFSIMPILGKAVIFALLPMLCLVTFLNIAAAHIIYKFLPENIKHEN
jgi:uncharacterized membrane protein